MTQSWVDVQPEIAFVDPPRAGTGGGSAVSLIPVLHPVPEGISALILGGAGGARASFSVFSFSTHSDFVLASTFFVFGRPLSS